MRGTVITHISCSYHTAVITHIPRSYRAVITQLSRIYHAVITHISRSYHASRTFLKYLQVSFQFGLHPRSTLIITLENVCIQSGVIVACEKMYMVLFFVCMRFTVTRTNAFYPLVASRHGRD